MRISLYELNRAGLSGDVILQYQSSSKCKRYTLWERYLSQKRPLEQFRGVYDKEYRGIPIHK